MDPNFRYKAGTITSTVYSYLWHYIADTTISFRIQNTSGPGIFSLHSTIPVSLRIILELSTQKYLQLEIKTTILTWNCGRKWKSKRTKPQEKT